MSGTLLIYANCQGDEMLSFLQRSAVLCALFQVERVFLGALHEFVAMHGTEAAEARLGRVTVVWEQASQASREERALMRTLVPRSARWLRFPALTCSTLWPFGTSDSRPGADPLFPYSDMLAGRLWRELGGAAGTLGAVSDDALFEHYMALSTRRMPDLERVLELDLAQWQERDLDADVPMADLLLEGLRRRQMFHTVGRASWAAMGDILQRLLSATIDGADDRRAVLADMQAMGADYVGNDSISMPIHPLVAERLGLDWYKPDALHDWLNYRLDFRGFILHCIRLNDLR